MQTITNRLLILVIAALIESYPPLLRAFDAPVETPTEPVRCLGSTRYRNPGPIMYACLDPSARTLFTLSENGVHAWDLQTGTGRFLFSGHRLRNALSVSPDGKLLASIAADAVMLWDANTGALAKEFEASYSAHSVAFQPNGKGVIIFREKSIEWRGLDSDRLRIVGDAAEHCWPHFSPDGKWFAVRAPGEGSDEIIIYDAQSLQKKTSLHVGGGAFGEGPVLSMVRAGFSGDGSRLAVPSAQGSVSTWNANMGKVVRTLQPSLPQRTAAEADYRYFLFAPDDKQLFVGTTAGTIRRWDMATGRELPPFRAHRETIRSLHLSRAGKELVSSCADGTIRRWDIAAGREIKPPDGYTGSVYAHLSPDGNSVLLLDVAGRMDVWDLMNGRLRTPIRTSAAMALDTPWRDWHFGFFPDGNGVFLAEENGKISVWDAATGKLTRSLTLPGYGARKNQLRFGVGGPGANTLLINRGTSRLRLFDVSSGKDVWESAELSVRGLCRTPAYPPKAKHIWLGVTTFEDKPYTELRGKLELVRLDTANGKVLDRSTLKSASTGDPSWFEQPRLTADGRTLLLSYGPVEIFLADAVTNKELHRYSLFLDRAALSADGKWMIGGSLGGLEVYDTATGKKSSRLPTGDQTLFSLEVLRDGRHVFTTGEGGRACLWDLKAALPAK
ncbi:MAG TPA: WD40 repeat domain-containing protein [Gemmataceae bacterium]|nr:WD40 repeat domain-containing protein [Gemmataceae bacterium]